MGVPADRIRLVYNAPDPAFFDAQPRRSEARRAAAHPGALPDSTIRSCSTPAISGPQKNIPRLVEAFAVVREQLADHPVYKDLRLIIIGDRFRSIPRCARR